MTPYSCSLFWPLVYCLAASGWVVFEVGTTAGVLLVALVGYPSSHARSDQDVAEEVYDPDLLEFTMGTERVVLNQRDVVGKALQDLNLEGQHGCFIDGVTRAQVELPLDRGLTLNRGDVLTVSGERNRLQKFADEIGFIDQRSDVSDLMSFSFFFVLGYAGTYTFSNVFLTLSGAAIVLL